MNSSTLAILVPIYDDWQSFEMLVNELENALKVAKQKAIIIAIDDGSLTCLYANLREKFERLSSVSKVEVVHLARNLGHQKAIAIGLSYIHSTISCNAVLVMDSDGEDRPIDALRLIDDWIKSPEKIVFARRSNRSEGWFFRMFYWIYRFIFRILTGNNIFFGNFSIIPDELLKRVVYLPEIWNHYAAGLLRANIPWRSIPTVRGKRYHGQSRMNFIGLVLHGLSAISVYIEIVAVRLIIATLFMIFLIGIGFIVILYIKLWTSLAIPGWATNVAIGLTMITSQFILFLTLLTFLVLNFRTNKLFVPALDFADYLLNVEKLK